MQHLSQLQKVMCSMEDIKKTHPYLIKNNFVFLLVLIYFYCSDELVKKGGYLDSFD